MRGTSTEVVKYNNDHKPFAESCIVCLRAFAYSVSLINNNKHPNKLVLSINDQNDEQDWHKL